MAYNVFPDRAGGYALVDADWNTYLRDNINDNMWNLVATTNDPGAGWTVSSLNSLPFKHLRIVGYVRSVFASTGPHTVSLRLNGDSGALYDRQEAGIAGVSAAYGLTISGTSWTISNMPGSTSPAGYFSSFVTDLPGITDTSRYQRFFSIFSTRNNTGSGNSYTYTLNGQYRSASAITSLQVIQVSSSFTVGSQVSLYGAT